MSRAASIAVTTRALRAELRETLALAAKGKEVVITLRGKPYVRIVAVTPGDETEAPAAEPRKVAKKAKPAAKAAKKK